jgi:hypothetical protein
VPQAGDVDGHQPFGVGGRGPHGGDRGVGPGRFTDDGTDARRQRATSRGKGGTDQPGPVPRIRQQNRPVLPEFPKHVRQVVQRGPRAAASLENLSRHQACRACPVGRSLEPAVIRQSPGVAGGHAQIPPAEGDGGDHRQR